MKFTDKLHTAWAETNSLLTVGLDPDRNQLPESLKQSPKAIFDFCKGIVDACAPYASSFKPQIAYFSAAGAETQLEQLCEYIRVAYPKHVLILDAKRGDIGSTAEQYACEAFDRYQADAVTVNPFMGYDSVEPYLRRNDKGVVILCRTSNPGGSDLQFLNVDQTPLFLHLAGLIADKWNKTGQCALVVGATFPDELAMIRARVGSEMPLLIPGIGAQGGSIEKTVYAGRNNHGTGMMISSSRAIIYASKGDDWQTAAALIAQQTRDEINLYRN